MSHESPASSCVFILLFFFFLTKTLGTREGFENSKKREGPLWQLDNGQWAKHRLAGQWAEQKTSGWWAKQVPARPWPKQKPVGQWTQFFATERIRRQRRLQRASTNLSWSPFLWPIRLFLREVIETKPLIPVLIAQLSSHLRILVLGPREVVPQLPNAVIL